MTLTLTDTDRQTQTNKYYRQMEANMQTDAKRHRQGVTDKQTDTKKNGQKRIKRTDTDKYK